MARAVSRDSFNELKNYLGVYLQQGRPMLDSDWNENQDIAVSFMRRVIRESLGDGSPNRGFAIDSVLPAADPQSLFSFLFAPLLFLLNFPGPGLDEFGSLQGFQLSSAQGLLRIAREGYGGKSFLRLSGHPGTVTVRKTLPGSVDLSGFEIATFRYRISHPTAGVIKFFVEDDTGARSVWRFPNAGSAADVWLSGYALPLDASLHIVTTELPDGALNRTYRQELLAFSPYSPNAPNLAWSVSAGALPNGLTLSSSPTSAILAGQPTSSGPFNFTIRVTDPAATPTDATRRFTVTINPTGTDVQEIPSPSERLATLARVLANGGGGAEPPAGRAADLTRIRAYGFELYQDSAHPLTWDLSDLRLGTTSSPTYKNNFIIRGSELSEIQSLMGIFGSFIGATNSSPESLALQSIGELMNANLELSEPSIEHAGKYYVDGLPCVQLRDVLYSDQADPNDAPLAPPGTGKRTDTVYLDAWLEPVTYVDDPDIREVALGGPDTATRVRVHHRVRVAQGGPAPLGDGLGRGTLATEGTYTGTANRLYLVEIDSPGTIGGGATFRWSEDNGSTIQRVIQAIPPGSTRVVVEDGAPFHPGDRILIRKEFGQETHQVSAVFANVITLVSPTGSQLAALPAASQDPQFTTFAVADRPMVQRWNALKVPIAPDPNDPAISAAITLNDGVRIRFGGRSMRARDYWTFKTRYLAGDDESGIDPVTRIEALRFQRARGIVHHYAPLATITRDASSPDPGAIADIRDRRRRTGNASMASRRLAAMSISGTAPVDVGAIPLTPAARDSVYVVYLSGEVLAYPAPPPANARIFVSASFYNDRITDPVASPLTGRVEFRFFEFEVPRTVTLTPLQIVFQPGDPFEDLVGVLQSYSMFHPSDWIPTSMHVLVRLSHTGFYVAMSHWQATVVELKKRF